jgi:hypothetical protein
VHLIVVERFLTGITAWRCTLSSSDFELENSLLAQDEKAL